MMRSEEMRKLIEPIRTEYERALAETGDEKKAKEAVDSLKKRLPAVVWAGLFSARGDKNLTSYSNCLVGDVDGLTHLKANDLRSKLLVDPHVHVSFVSPTGHGVKAVVAVAGGPEDHEASFLAVKRYFADRYGVELDPSGRNRERLCFFSYQPDCRWRADVTRIEASGSDMLRSRLERSRKLQAEREERLADDPAEPEKNQGEKRKLRPRPCPGASALNDERHTMVDLEVRAQIAEKLLGSIHWKTATEGFLECPNISQHSTRDSDRDCRVTLDGAPTVHCFHAHCQPGTKEKPGGLDDVNYKLRSEIGKAERQKDEGAIAQLAHLDTLGYERAREAAAARLGVRNGALDALVRDERKRREQAEKGLSFEDVEPWPEPVDGLDLIGEIYDYVKRFLVLPSGGTLVYSIWGLFTHCFEIFDYAAIMNFQSPVMRCGKSLALEVLETFCARPLKVDGITAATLFRAVDRFKASVLLDEWDSLVGEDLVQAVRGILNSGVRKGGRVPRCNANTLEVELYSTFSPKAVSGIGSLPGTVADRSIPIRMRRKLPKEKTERFDIERCRNTEGTVLRRKCARWCLDNRANLEAAQPDMPKWMNDRQQDVWRPLLALADLTGCGEVARKAARLLCHNEDQGSPGAELLQDVREVLLTLADEGKIATDMLLLRLNKMDDRPWPTACSGKALHARRLADMLRPFGIAPKQIRIRAGSVKGYVLEQFQDAFDRYLQPLADTASNHQDDPN